MSARLLRLAAILLALESAGRAQSRVAFAEYELTGPLARVVLDAGIAGSATIEGALTAGETRRVLVPVPTSPGAPGIVPSADAGAGSARFLGWREREERLARIPAALRARPLPWADAARVRVGVAVLCVLAAAGALGLWLARSVVAALAVALAAATGAWILARSALDREAPPVEVLDGVAGSGAWQRARGARDALDLPARGASFDVVTDPRQAPIAVEVPLDAARPLRVRARGAKLVALWAEPWPPEALEPAANDLAPLAAAWWREDGDWTFRGAWRLGAALGPAVEPAEGRRAPPGWLVDGLPQGVTLVVGEVEGAARSYVRCTYP